MRRTNNSRLKPVKVVTVSRTPNLVQSNKEQIFRLLRKLVYSEIYEIVSSAETAAANRPEKQQKIKVSCRRNNLTFL